MTAADEEKEYYALLKRVFDRLAPFYDIAAFPISKLRDRVVDFAGARNSSKILDVCTGTGKQAFAFAKKGFDVTGIDLSDAMLGVATKKNTYANARFKIADATHLPFEDDSFDVSSVSFALHDMPLTIRERAVKEMVRVTRPRGLIMVIDYALPKNTIWKFFVYYFIKLYEGEYYEKFIQSDLDGLIEKSGIEIKEELPVVLGTGRIIKGIKKAKIRS